MKLRAWVVFPLAGILLAASFLVANGLLLRQFRGSAPPMGDFLHPIQPPLWYWLVIVGPPLLLIGAYVWQRVRSPNSE